MTNLKSQIDISNSKSKNTNTRVYLFTLMIIKFINTLPNNRSFWSIRDQLLRSATSIGANMIEAKASHSRKDFIRYYEIALKSANESKYWLCLIRDSYPAYCLECKNLLKELHEISNMLGSSVLTLKGRNKI